MSFFFRVTACLLVATLLSLSITPASPAGILPEQQVSFSNDADLQVRAIISNRGVLIEWRSELEATTLGFNVWRIRNGSRIQLNPGLSAGQVLISRARTQSYSWFDQSGTADSQYVVEAVDLKGQPAAESTVSPVWQTSLPAFRSAELLSRLGTSTAAQIRHP